MKRLSILILLPLLISANQTYGGAGKINIVIDNKSDRDISFKKAEIRVDDAPSVTRRESEGTIKAGESADLKIPLPVLGDLGAPKGSSHGLYIFALGEMNVLHSFFVKRKFKKEEIIQEFRIFPANNSLYVMGTGIGKKFDSYKIVPPTGIAVPVLKDLKEGHTYNVVLTIGKDIEDLATPIEKSITAKISNEPAATTKD